MPFQEFVIKWLPVPDAVFFLLRQTTDVAIISLFVWVLLTQIVRKGTVVTSRVGVEVLFLCFVLWAILLSALTSGSDVGTNFSEIYVISRYGLLFYSVIALKPTENEIAKLIKYISLSVLLQMCIGYAQFVGGDTVKVFFSARDYTNSISEVARSFTINRVDARAALSGTTGDFINFAYLMAVGLILYVTIPGRLVKRIIIMALVGVVLFLSGSRAISISVIFVVLGYVLWIRNVLARYLVFAVIFAVIFPVFFILMDLAKSVEYDYVSFWALFREETIISLLNQRLGMLVFFMPEFIASGDFIVGLSPDRFYIADVARRNYEGMPLVLISVFDQVFEDFYFIALFAYYGFVGFALYMTIFWKIFRVARELQESGDYLTRRVATISVLLLIIAIPLNIANQAFEARYFSFYLWLFAGLVVHMKRVQLVNSTNDYAHPAHP
jgi:hypothetical protein